MSDLYWPGDHRAGDLMSSGALVEAMVRVENAWLGVLVATSIAPVDAAAGLTDLVGPTTSASWSTTPNEVAIPSSPWSG